MDEDRIAEIIAQALKGGPLTCPYCGKLLLKMTWIEAKTSIRWSKIEFRGKGYYWDWGPEIPAKQKGAERQRLPMDFEDTRVQCTECDSVLPFTKEDVWAVGRPDYRKQSPKFLGENGRHSREDRCSPVGWTL